jgi:transposase InsO family protein
MEIGRRATSYEQRVAIGELAHAGRTDREIGQMLRLSPSVVRKWRRRGKLGAGGLISHMGRPARGPLGSWAAAVPAKLVQLRTAHPGWGPLTLQAELACPPHGLGPRRPGRTQIAAFLKAQHLVRAHPPRVARPEPPAPGAGPHAEWQMDALGVQTLPNGTAVVVINIGDPFTRLLTESLACLQVRKASLPDYQCALRRAFWRFGLPTSLSLDHDSVFCDPTSTTPYPTRLHLWLLALGITVRFIAVARPTQHGFIERTHQTVIHQVLDDGHLPAANLQATLDARGHFMNTTYPNRAIGGQPPLAAFPSAAHTARAYTPEAEPHLLDPQPVYAYLAAGHWQRRVTERGQFELGGYRYGLGQGWGQPVVQLTFDPQTQELVAQTLDTRQTRRLPAQGLTPADWAGELPLDRLPSYQLSLPISPAANRFNLLLDPPSGTTFPDQRL